MGALGKFDKSEARPNSTPVLQPPKTRDLKPGEFEVAIGVRMSMASLCSEAYAILDTTDSRLWRRSRACGVTLR